MRGMDKFSKLDDLKYPESKFMRAVYRLPVLFYRLGFGPLVGKLFMILTTTGRKSGLPRQTAIEYHQFNRRIYVYSAWGERSDWYKNTLADPKVTIQTGNNVQSASAHRLITDEEYAAAYQAAAADSFIRAASVLVGFRLSEEEFLRNKSRFTLIAFDPADHSPAPAVKADLWWVSVLTGLALL